jgi:murein DD-endopeptidase MepM/ murein hydrolase activator NlpD
MPQPIFPLPVPPLDPFWDKTSQTSINYQRDGGKRRHAGVDLVANTGTPVLAMADGVVLQVAEFYQGTWAIVVLHPGLGTVRYGEVDRQVLVRPHQAVHQGDAIGIVGKRKGSERAMLHLEWYADFRHFDTPSEGDPHLSQKQNRPYERRSDLADPTKLLRRSPVQGWPHSIAAQSPTADPTRDRLVQLLKTLRFSSRKPELNDPCLNEIK